MTTKACEDIIKEALKWQGACLSAQCEIEKRFKENALKNRLTIRVANLSSKSYLDNYLMKKFNLDAFGARGISNTITSQNLKPIAASWTDNEFKDEPFVLKAIEILKQGSQIS